MNSRLVASRPGAGRPTSLVARLSSEESLGWRSMAVTSAWPKANHIVSATRTSGSRLRYLS
jgi:hypothetical protein